MSFEKDKENIIELFKKNIADDLKLNGDRVVNKFKESIDDSFEKHRDCYNNRHRIFCDPTEDVFDIHFYSESNISIVCKACDTIIFDSDVIVSEGLTTEEKREYIKRNFDIYIEQYNDSELDLFISQMYKTK